MPRIIWLMVILVLMPSVEAMDPYDPREVVNNCETGPCEGQKSFRSGLTVKKLDRAITPKSPLCKNVSVAEADVARDIFHKHYHWERPLVDSSKPIDIEIRLVLQSINDVIEKDRILKLTGYLLIYWYDEYHVWNTTWPHACVNYVVLPPTEVWIPEIAMINSAQHYELLLMYNQELVRVDSTGYTRYRPGGTFGVFCDFDLTYFPFDEQTCVLTMESWRYNVENQIFHFGDAIQLRYWIENEQWQLVNTTQRTIDAHYVTSNVYHRVEFQLSLKRKVGYYLINVIVPSVIISIAEVATFTLPVDEVMKIHISFTCLLAYGVFQLMIIEDIPRTSDRIPLLCYYIALSMAYICFAMIGEGLVFVCIRKGNDRRHKQYVPDLIYKYACLTGKILWIREPSATIPINNNPDNEERSAVRMAKNYSNMESTVFVSLLDAIEVPSELGKKQEQNKLELEEKLTHHDAEIQRRHRWEFVADVLDRSVLVLYLIFIFLTPVIMFGVIPKKVEKY